MATYAQFKSWGPYFSGGVLCTLKVYHYASGTTTLQDGWTDRDKSSTIAQPLVSDSEGIASAWWDGLYKFRIDVATDGVNYSTLYTYDKVAVVDQSETLAGEGTAIASASTLTLGTDGSIFHVTGSTGPITAISGNQNTVTLIFDSTPTLTHSGNLILQYAEDFTAAANDTMVLFNEGSGVWRELSRTPSKDSAFRVVGSADATKKLAFEVDGITAATTRTVTVQDENGTMALTSEFDYANLAGSSGRMPFPAMWMQGLTYSNNSGDATNDLDIAAGQCRDATNAHNIIVSALTKRSDATFVVGTNQGMLDTGAVGNSDYYLFAIKRSDTGICDVLCSLSSTSPTMPASYDYKRLIGWFKRVGGTIVAFHTYEGFGGGLELLWDSPTLDIDLTNTLTTSRRTDAVKVPLNFSVIAHLNVVLADAGAVGTTYIYCPDMTDLAPSPTAAPLFSNKVHNTNLTPNGAPMSVRTSATGTIAARSELGTADAYQVATLGFTWARRN